MWDRHQSANVGRASTVGRQIDIAQTNQLPIEDEGLLSSVRTCDYEHGFVMNETDAMEACASRRATSKLEIRC